MLGGAEERNDRRDNSQPGTICGLLQSNGIAAPVADQNEYQIPFASCVSFVIVLASLDHSGLS
jgi:hypothetical protein